MEGTSALITQLMSAQNDERKNAESTLRDRRTTDGQGLLNGLVSYINDRSRNEQEAGFASIILKKQFLDDRKEEEGLWQPTGDELNRIKSEISTGLEFETSSRLLLKRRADIISKCYSKLDN